MFTIADLFNDADRHLDVLTRFVGRLDTDGPIPVHRPELGNCWTWTGCTDHGGYGRFSVGGREYGSHRAVYQLIYGSIQDGLVVDHLCHRHDCGRPSHLRAVTVKANTEHRFGPNWTKGRTAPYRGVSWHSRIGAWQATVRHNGRKVHGGYHSTPEKAAAAASALRLRLFDYSDMDRPRGPENAPQALALATA